MSNSHIYSLVLKRHDNTRKLNTIELLLTPAAHPEKSMLIRPKVLNTVKYI